MRVKPRDVAGQGAGDPGVPPLDAEVSAVTGEGLPSLVGAMVEQVRAARALEEEPEGWVVHRPVPEGVRVERDDSGAFVVLGRQAERAVALSDLTDPDAQAVVWERLRKLGVGRALARAGCGDGDTVVIGDMAFDYEADLT